MSTTTDTTLEASRKMLQGFGRHYDYDVSYLEELLDTSADAFRAFEAAMPMARVKKVAPTEAVFIAKIAAMRAQDCGPCTELTLKMAREAGLAEPVIQGALRGGKGLTAEQREIHDYAVGVALNEELDPELLPRLQERLGREAIAEIAVNILATKLYPTLKRALGHAKSCSLIPALN
jgi:alkylhydroperoxidase family enzyme